MTRDMKLTDIALEAVAEERWRQEAKFPDQRLELGQADGDAAMTLSDLRYANDNGHATWFSVLLEEMYEAMLESDPAKVRAEMVQVAAVATRIVENIDAGALLT